MKIVMLIYFKSMIILFYFSQRLSVLLEDLELED